MSRGQLTVGGRLRWQGVVGRAALVIAIGITVALTLAACGGSSTQSSESASTEQEQSSESAGESNAETTSKTASGNARALAGVRASILHYGKAGTKAEGAAAAMILKAFISDREDGFWPAACSYLSAEMKTRTKQIGGPGYTGCRKGIEALTASSSTKEARVIAVKELRREGGQAFLIYRDEAEEINAMLMVFEGGKWKLAGVNPTPLFSS